MKKHIVAICISILLANLAIAKNALPLVNGIDDATPELRNWMINNPPTVKPGHLELIAVTDKRQYLLGEPVTLTIAVKNNTDKDLKLDYPIGFFGSTAIAVFKPSDSKQTAGTDGKKPETTTERAKDRGNTVYGAGDRYEVPAKGMLSFCCILSNWYDLTWPNGKYTVKIKHMIKQNLQFVFTMDAALSFEILPRIANTDAIAAEDMTSVFGRERAMEILGKEAESILAKIEGDGVTDIGKSPENGRLMMILRTIDEGTTHLGADHKLKSLEESNRMSIKDLREFINLCLNAESK